MERVSGVRRILAASMMMAGLAAATALAAPAVKEDVRSVRRATQWTQA